MIDREGVGELVRIGIERGRKTRPNLEVGDLRRTRRRPIIRRVLPRGGNGLRSRSPFRVLTARLAAAQAVQATG